MKINRGLVAGALLLISGAALAQAQPGMDGVQDVVTQALKSSAVNQIEPKVRGWLGGFLILQYVLTNGRMLLQGGDLEKAFAKLFLAISWAGVCLTAVTYGPEFIDSVGNDLLGHFLSSVPSASAVLAAVVPLATTILAAAGAISGFNTALASILVGVFWVVAGGGVYLAFKVFMYYLELAMIVALSPLCFVLLGLDSFKEQGFAPLKSLISLVYRVVLFGCIFGAFKFVTNYAVDAFNAINWMDITSVGTNVKTAVSCLFSYPVLLFLAFKADSIAATLAGGSSSLGTGDVGQAIAAGAAAGAAASAAGSATTGAAVTAPKSMASFMSKLLGGSSVSNASAMGSGGGDPPSFNAPKPALSAGAPAGGSAGGGASAPQPPSRPPSGAASPPMSSNVASGRYGDSLPGEGTGQRDAPNAPSAVQSAATEGTNGASEAGQAAGTPAGLQGNSADGPTTAPGTSLQGSAAEQARAVPEASPATSSNKNDTSGRYGTELPEAASPAPGKASNAAISGPPASESSRLEEKLEKLVDHMTQPKKPTLGERLGEANRHLQQEQAETRIAMSAHAND
ncbi:hypothetical protein LBW59_16755 [Ralstonia solanacearum]|uniref:Uncharacterized protein n=1 Tax=Ralstonia solanacearum TaxID=305 RepID=A0AAW5ZSN5_RALSL|nr:hypothetical protein [Ralstonia solanacearum]MDB0572413.1 hypothetical protein [Ralstonia solanacearum]